MQQQLAWKATLHYDVQFSNSFMYISYILILKMSSYNLRSNFRNQSFESDSGVTQHGSLLSRLIAASDNEADFLRTIRDYDIVYNTDLNLFVHLNIVDRNEKSIMNGIRALLNICSQRFPYFPMDQQTLNKIAFTALFRAVQLFNQLKSHYQFSASSVEMNISRFSSSLKNYFGAQQPGFFAPRTMGTMAQNLNMHIIQFAVWCGVEKCFYSLKTCDMQDPSIYNVKTQNNTIDQNKWDEVMSAYVAAMALCFR